MYHTRMTLFIFITIFCGTNNSTENIRCILNVESMRISCGESLITNNIVMDLSNVMDLTLLIGYYCVPIVTTRMIRCYYFMHWFPNTNHNRHPKILTNKHVIVFRIATTLNITVQCWLYVK